MRGDEYIDLYSPRRIYVNFLVMLERVNSMVELKVQEGKWGWEGVDRQSLFIVRRKKMVYL